MEKVSESGHNSIFASRPSPAENPYYSFYVLENDIILLGKLQPTSPLHRNRISIDFFSFLIQETLDSKRREE